MGLFVGMPINGLNFPHIEVPAESLHVTLVHFGRVGISTPLIESLCKATRGLDALRLTTGPPFHLGTHTVLGIEPAAKVRELASYLKTATGCRSASGGNTPHITLTKGRKPLPELIEVFEAQEVGVTELVLWESSHGRLTEIRTFPLLQQKVLF